MATPRPAGSPVSLETLCPNVSRAMVAVDVEPRRRFPVAVKQETGAL